MFKPAMALFGVYSQIFTVPFEAGMVSRDDMQKRIRATFLKAGTNFMVNW